MIITRIVRCVKLTEAKGKQLVQRNYVSNSYCEKEKKYIYKYIHIPVKQS